MSPDTQGQPNSVLLRTLRPRIRAAGAASCPALAAWVLGGGVVGLPRPRGGAGARADQTAAMRRPAHPPASAPPLPTSTEPSSTIARPGGCGCWHPPRAARRVWLTGPGAAVTTSPAPGRTPAQATTPPEAHHTAPQRPHPTAPPSAGHRVVPLRPMRSTRRDHRPPRQRRKAPQHGDQSPLQAEAQDPVTTPPTPRPPHQQQAPAAAPHALYRGPVRSGPGILSQGDTPFTTCLAWMSRHRP